MNANSSDTVLLLQYGLKTHRQKRRTVVKDRDKQLIQLHIEKMRLRIEEASVGWEELKRPYQRGWMRSFVLREDVAFSKKALFFRNLLQKINTLQYSSKRNFTKKKNVRGKKVYVPRKQKLKEIDEWDLRRMRFSEEQFQMFVKDVFYCTKGKSWQTKYVFSEPWRFVLKVEPNMITRVRKHDSLLVSNIVRLNNFIQKNDLEHRMDKLRFGFIPKWGYRRYDFGPLEPDPFKNKKLESILDEHWYNK